MDDYLFDSTAEVGNVVYQVVPLHEVPEVTDECCSLINMEWKRSHVARFRSICNSSENFPTSLVLLNASDPKVLGHCKITRLAPLTPAVFVETVVIHPQFRGQGLGKLLMEKTEQYLQSKKIKYIYLTTKGQELFYQKLGYFECEPVNIYGCALPRGFEQLSLNEEQCQKNMMKNNLQEKIDSSQIAAAGTNFHTVPKPPPLPPLPSVPLYQTQSKVLKSNLNLPSHFSLKKTYMRKVLMEKG